jgi:hypothetical protein
MGESKKEMRPVAGIIFRRAHADSHGFDYRVIAGFSHSAIKGDLFIPHPHAGKVIERLGEGEIGDASIYPSKPGIHRIAAQPYRKLEKAQPDLFELMSQKGAFSLMEERILRDYGRLHRTDKMDQSTANDARKKMLEQTDRAEAITKMMPILWEYGRLLAYNKAKQASK